MSKFNNYGEQITLNNLHYCKIDEYNRSELNLPKKREQLDQAAEKLKKMRDKIEQRGYIPTEKDDLLIDKLINRIEKLEVEIHKMENNYEMLNYLNNTKNIIEKYYEENKNVIVLTPIVDHKILKKIPKKKNKNQKKYDFAVNMKTFFSPNANKKDYFQDYIDIIEEVDSDTQKFNEHVIICETCNVEKIILISEGSAVCSICGEVEFIIIEPEKQSNKENSGNKKSHTYQRVNHFRERLSQFQEPCTIEDNIYKLIIKELHTQGYRDLTILCEPYIQTDLMRKILKKLKLNSYYKYCAHIICVLTNSDVPEISDELYQILIKMFELIQQPFEKHKPPNRINFLSYSYVFFKFLELLSLDKLKQSFTLLKSEKKLREQDEVWKKICSELNWPFYYSPSGRGRHINQLIW